jgi:hypothetical protein
MHRRPSQVMDATGAGSFSTIIRGLQWVKEYAAVAGLRAAVANLSIGGTRSASMNDAVEDLAAAGIVPVVAAGNRLASTAFVSHCRCQWPLGPCPHGAGGSTAAHADIHFTSGRF